jgi:phosphatidylglycerol:prolipoprotein diacylglycerol transferase
LAVSIALDPVALQIGAMSLRWSALAYPATLVACAATLFRLQRRERLLPAGQWPFDLCVWVAVGVVLGARLGEIVLYQPAYFLAHPFEIVALGHGGMASHGALLGAFVAAWVFARRREMDGWLLLDALAVAAPWGFLFARLGNFVDGRPMGAPTDVAWAIIHPALDAVARHPVQLYGAFSEGVLLWGLLLAFPYPRFGIGSRAAFACIAYGAIRIVVEAFKAPDPEPGIVATGIAHGQLYSLVLLAAGVAVLIRVNPRIARRR